MNELDTILVASDLTEASDEVVRTAGEIAAASGARLHLIHAFDLPAGAGSTQQPGSRPGFMERVREAEQALEAQAARAVPEGVTVGERKVEIYVAEKAIAEWADSLGAQLIVVGPHSTRRMGDDFLGGTADRVIRAARVPVLVVRAPVPLPLQRVVTPVDRSAVATNALEQAISWAAQLGQEGSATEVTAIHVLPRALDTPGLNLDPDSIRRGIHEEIQGVADRLGDDSRVRIQEEIRWGESANEEIVNYLQEVTADLVVMGTHSRGMLKRFLIGSVASGVARSAPCSILLVPAAGGTAVRAERNTD